MPDIITFSIRAYNGRECVYSDANLKDGPLRWPAPLDSRRVTAEDCATVMPPGIIKNLPKDTAHTFAPMIDFLNDRKLKPRSGTRENSFLWLEDIFQYHPGYMTYIKTQLGILHEREKSPNRSPTPPKQSPTTHSRAPSSSLDLIFSVVEHSTGFGNLRRLVFKDGNPVYWSLPNQDRYAVVTIKNFYEVMPSAVLDLWPEFKKDLNAYHNVFIWLKKHAEVHNALVKNKSAKVLSFTFKGLNPSNADATHLLKDHTAMKLSLIQALEWLKRIKRKYQLKIKKRIRQKKK